MATASSFTALPDDVLNRVLLGVTLDDHDATAAACRAFRDVIRGPKFLHLRQEYGFAERCMILVGQRDINVADRPLEINVAGKPGAVAITNDLRIHTYGAAFRCATTDGGARMFVTTWRHANGGPTLVLAFDGSSRRWSHFATLPLYQSLHCLAWHGGLLYVAGGLGCVGNIRNRCLITLHSFNETTGAWEDLPPMPHACSLAASGIIGNELFVAGGRVWHTVNGVGHSEDLSTLQIYDFTTRTWRLGAPLPRRRCGACGIVVDGKLYLVSSKLSDLYYDGQSSTMVYDVQSNTWTELPDPPLSRFGACTLHAFAHNGRIVAFNQSGSAFQLGTHGGWYRFDLDVAPAILQSYIGRNGVAGSVILG